MPLDMPSNLTALKNQISQPGSWVCLLTITLPSGTILRFCSNNEDVVYGGHTYTAFNFSFDSFVTNTTGELPEVTMVVTNVGYVLQEDMRANNGLIGSTFSFVDVNTSCLAEDWSEDAITLTVTGAQNRWPDIEFPLGVHPAMRYRVPEDRLNPHSCRHAFRTPAGEYTCRCGYTGKSIVAITLSGTSVVSVQVTGHGFITGDIVRIYSLVGITGGLAGDYTITKTGTNTFTLDGTDSSDYSGTFTSGKAGYAWCQRIPTDCLARGQFPGSYGGPLSLRKEAVRYA